MGKIRRVMRCYNCGAVLQSTDTQEIGYIKNDLLVSAENEGRVIYCDNCYEKMKAINTGMLEVDSDGEILKILDDAVATDALIIWVIDLFSFNGVINSDIVKKVKNLDVIVLATHLDIFPKRVKQEQLIEFVQARFKEVGITPKVVRLIGNTEKIDASLMLAKLNEYRKGHDVYMIGTIASGKTSIINKMLKGYKNKSKRTVKTEFYPGTGIKVLEVPLSNSSFFYELPGFSLNTSVLGKVEKEVKAIITPKKEIEMQRVVLDQGEVLAVGSLGAFILSQGKSTSFHFYGAEGIELKKLHHNDLDEFFHKNSIKRSYRPVSNRFSSFQDYDVFEYTMENDGHDHDIAITGLGWVRFEGKGQIVRVVCPKGAAIKETLSKIKGRRHQ